MTSQESWNRKTNRSLGGKNQKKKKGGTSPYPAEVLFMVWIMMLKSLENIKKKE